MSQTAANSLPASRTEPDTSRYAGLRILFLGENWFGSSSRACCYALRRLGCDVFDVDQQTIFPQLVRRPVRAAMRLLWPSLHREYNRIVLESAEIFRPDVVLATKGQFIEQRTLRELKRRGAALYNYYPDTSFAYWGKRLRESVAEYDCIFVTKPFQVEDLRRMNVTGEVVFVPHGYDPDLHQPWPLTSRDVTELRSDVLVVATHTTHKESVLDALLERMPELDLKIWGGGWGERCRSRRVLDHATGIRLTGLPYAKAMLASRINLAIMSGPWPGASQHDQTTTRSYEIPASGGFMLHERNQEIRGLFEEDKEMACFESPDELAMKVRYFLDRPLEREAIARAGYLRCVPAHSYDRRMNEILDWHLRFAGFDSDRPEVAEQTSDTRPNPTAPRCQGTPRRIGNSE